MNALDHLLARSTGGLETVRPRLPGRFESTPSELAPDVQSSTPDEGADDSWGEVDDERTARPTVSRRSPERRPEPPKQTLRARIETSPVDAVDTEPTVPTLAPVPKAPLSNDLSPSSDPPIPAPQEVDQAASLAPIDGLSPVAGESATFDGATRPSEPTEPSRPHAPSLQDLLPESRSVERPQPWSPAEPTLAVPHGLTAPTPEPPPAAEPARPRIDVRIGRIEVRRAPEARAVSPTPPRARIRRATVSLEDYLRRRGS